MKRLMIAAALWPVPVMAQTKAVPAAAPGPAGTCASLAHQYDAASMDLAANFASGVGDNSAPRATLRAMEDANTLATARITLDLMRDNRCAAPKSPPDAISYLSAALPCATDRLKQGGTTSPASCDRATWQKITK